MEEHQDSVGSVKEGEEERRRGGGEEEGKKEVMGEEGERKVRKSKRR